MGWGYHQQVIELVFPGFKFKPLEALMQWIPHQYIVRSLTRRSAPVTVFQSQRSKEESSTFGYFFKFALVMLCLHEYIKMCAKQV